MTPIDKEGNPQRNVGLLILILTILFFFWITSKYNNYFCVDNESFTILCSFNHIDHTLNKILESITF